MKRYGMASCGAVWAILAMAFSASASDTTSMQEGRLRLQEQEVLAAGIAFVTQIVPKALRYDIAGEAVDARVLAFAAGRSKHVLVGRSLEAPTARDAGNARVEVRVGQLSWTSPEEAVLVLTYRLTNGEFARCDLGIVHSDSSPSWGIGISADPSCRPNGSIDGSVTK